MMSEHLIELARVDIEAGHRIDQVARHIVAQSPLIEAKQLIAVLKAAASQDVSAVSFAAGDEVADAIYYAAIAVAALPDTTPSELAIALKDPQNFPNLTALQMGQVLKATGVFPAITAQQMQDALTAAAYSPTDVTAAIAQLFPQPTTSYRRLGPAGATGQMPFDDNSEATGGQPLTQLNIRHGNIIDHIQAYYGTPPVAAAAHGGGGGGATVVNLTNDPIVAVSGYTGYWFGGSYVLQITIRTKSNVFGPYGDMAYAQSSTPFSFQVEANEQIVGFFGSAAYGNNGQSVFLGSLGVIVKTN